MDSAQQNMSLSQQGLDFIKGYEKFRPTVYDNGGSVTEPNFTAYRYSGHDKNGRVARK